MLNRMLFLLALVFLISACSEKPQGSSGNAPTTSNSLPNVVFLLVDDIGLSSIPAAANPSAAGIGWTSTNSNGQDSVAYELPNINAFAQEARVYSNMYATSLCAPSRGELITGRYPFRNGIVDPQWNMDSLAAPFWPNNADSNNAITTALGYLDTLQIGYPEVMRAMGYSTSFGGKWNLRYGQSMCHMDGKGDTMYTSEYYMDSLVPRQRAHLNSMGFDSTFGPLALLGNRIDYYPPQLTDAGNLKEQYLSDSLHNWMKNSVIKGRAKGKPHYAHYCFGLIHDPDEAQICHDYGYSPPPSDSGDTNPNRTWAAKVAEVDMLIGQFIRFIDSLDAASGTNTLIILAGDNGTENTYYSSYNGNWVQGGKTQNISNGGRVPFMVRWKGSVNPGIDSTLADFTDIFPTMVELVDGSESLRALVARNNPGYEPNFICQSQNAMTSNSYVLDGQSLLYDMTEGKMGSQVQPRKAIYGQTNGQALLCNAGYKLGITSFKGFYRINDQNLADIVIDPRVLISAIGDSALQKPHFHNVNDLANYRQLCEHYNLLFPYLARE